MNPHLPLRKEADDEKQAQSKINSQQQERRVKLFVGKPAIDKGDVIWYFK